MDHLENDIMSKTIKVTLEVDKFLLNEANNLQKLESEILLSKNSNLLQVLEKIGLDQKYIGFITVNKEIKPFNQVLQNKDKLALYPYIIGG